MTSMKKISLPPPQLKLNGAESDPYFGSIEHQIAELSGFSQLIWTVTRPDSIALDVGANIGISSLMLGMRLGRGKIYAFEPSPKNYEFLTKNLKNNGLENCETFCMAIGETAGELKFHESIFGAGSHVVSDEHLAHDTTPTISVPVHSIDELAKKLNITKLDFIKIDVEGHECAVLDGAKKTLASLKPVVFMEFNSWTTIAFGNTNPRELLTKFMNTFPYVYNISKDGKISRIENSEQPILGFLHQNLVKHGCVDDLIGAYRDLTEDFA